MAEGMISRYQILDRLGAGGMGEVYKALDTKMRREVALKLLPPGYVQDADRVARFKKEAFATSALNHPNITTIFEIDEADGQHFISLEYISGHALRVLIRDGKLEQRQVLEIAVQVAEGLHAAHEAGIVHRDLKPENIMVRPDGIAKILDFGLAKLGSAPEPPRPGDETLVQSSSGGAGLTQPGMVLGTVAYMSPEQARGLETDRRSDIFTFGSILLEMLTRKQPFHAPSSVEVMHAIIHDAPPSLQGLSGSVPVELHRIVRKAMAKDPGERYQTAKDLAIDLRALQRDLDSGSVSAVHAAVATTPAPGTVPPAAKRSKHGLFIAAIFAVFGSLVVVVLMNRGPRTSGTAPALPLAISKITNTGNAGAPIFAPRGQFLAYTNTDDDDVSIRVRQLATGVEVEAVPATADVGLGNMAFSPDGNWLLYTTRKRTESVRTLWQVSPLGGTPREVMKDVDGPPSFFPDGTRFVFQRANEQRQMRFFVVPFGAPGEPEEIHSIPEAAIGMSTPLLSPDGREILYVQLNRDDVLHPRLMIKTLDGGALRPVPGPTWMQLLGICWAQDGKGIYVAGSSSWMARSQIWYVGLDEGVVRRVTQDLEEHSQIALRGDGHGLASVRTTVSAQLWRVPLEGTPEENGARANQITQGTGLMGWPQVSPDGKTVALVSEASGYMDLWAMDVDGSNLRQLTFGPAQDFGQSWSPDGSQLAFASESEGDLQVWVVDANGHNTRQLTHQGKTNYGPSWSPDGRWIAFIASVADSAFPCKIPAEGGDPIFLSRTDLAMMLTRWSPDGRFIATWLQPEKATPQFAVGLFSASSNEVRRIPILPRSRWTLLGLHWTPDGRELSLVDQVQGAWAVQRMPLDGGDRTTVASFTGDLTLFNFDWVPDGRALIAQRGSISSDIVLIENLP